jgi:uncharacterized protein involved in outer membrane biogenesis
MTLRARRRMRSLAARAAWSVGVLVLLVVASHPFWLAPLLSRHLTATSGREVHFDSATIGLTSALAPVVHLRGVRIANAPWATSKAPFAALSDAVFVLAWRRFEGRHVVSYALLRNGVVDLERSADGRRNWRLSDPEDRGAGHYWFFSLEAHALDFAFVHQGIDLDVHAAASETAAAKAATGEALSTRIDVHGTFRKVAFHGSLATGPVLTFLRTSRWFGVRGHAEIDGAGLDVDGHAADLFRATQVDARATFAGQSLAALRPLVGARYAEPRAFRVDGRVRISLGEGEARYALETAKAHIGATDLAGDLAWSHEGSQHALRAHLTSERTDVADLLWLAGRSASDIDAAAGAAADPSTAAPGRDLFAGLRKLDADVAFESTQVHAAMLRALQSLKLKADLAAGQLAVTGLDVGWGGGHTRGTLGLDLRSPLAVAHAVLETSGVRIESLFASPDEKKRITGILQGRLTLRASGNTSQALRASADGAGSLQLSGGTISSLLDAEMGLEGGKLMRTLISGVDALPLPCAAATFDVTSGRARITDLVVDSANTRTGGRGTIDLRDGAIDLVLTPQPKRPGLFELDRSIRLSGRLPKPQRSLVDRVAPPPSAACLTTKS